MQVITYILRHGYQNHFKMQEINLNTQPILFQTPHTIIYGNVGTVAKDDVDVDVTYSDVTVMKRTGTIVLLPDTSEYATVMTSK